METEQTERILKVIKKLRRGKRLPKIPAIRRAKVKPLPGRGNITSGWCFTYMDVECFIDFAGPSHTLRGYVKWPQDCERPDAALFKDIHVVGARFLEANLFGFQCNLLCDTVGFAGASKKTVDYCVTELHKLVRAVHAQVDDK